MTDIYFNFLFVELVEKLFYIKKPFQLNETVYNLSSYICKIKKIVQIHINIYLLFIN